MGIIDLKIYTYEKFCKRLDYYAVQEFVDRCGKLSFKPKFIITWEVSEKETSKKINEWCNEEQFIGNINKYWLCQIEFEREEDVMAFKLRWM